MDPAALKRFEGTHPAVMANWFAAHLDAGFVPADPNTYRPDIRERRYRLTMAVEKLLSVDLSKKHFRLVR